MTWIVEDYTTGNTTECDTELDAAYLCKQLWDLFPDDGGRFGYYTEE